MDPRWVIGITLWTFLSGPIFAGNGWAPKSDHSAKQVIAAQNASVRNLPPRPKE